MALAIPPFTGLMCLAFDIMSAPASGARLGEAQRPVQPPLWIASHERRHETEQKTKDRKIRNGEGNEVQRWEPIVSRFHLRGAPHGQPDQGSYDCYQKQGSDYQSQETPAFFLKAHDYRFTLLRYTGIASSRKAPSHRAPQDWYVPWAVMQRSGVAHTSPAG